MSTYNPHDYHTYPQSFIENGEHEGTTWEHHVLDKLENLHVVLQGIHKTLNAPIAEEVTDQRLVQVLFKSGLGPNWIPNTHGRFYTYVWAPVSTAINVTSAVGSPFVLTLPAVSLPSMWNLLDLPDQSSIILDASASANQMNIFVLYTNKKL